MRVLGSGAMVEQFEARRSADAGGARRKARGSIGEVHGHCTRGARSLPLRHVPTRHSGRGSLMRPGSVFSVFLLAAGLSAAIDQTTFAARGNATRSPVWAQHGMVCAAQPLAVQVGVDILKQGGSAVDAAIAVNACLGLMEPTSNGLGGDMFALVWDPAEKKLIGLNGSGRAPLGLTADKVKADPDGTIPQFSPYTWTVPGACDGWFELHKRFGKLPMKTLL